MPWTLVRLELGSTEEFPQGSAARAFCLRIPIDIDGRIEADLHANAPLHATARCFWPNRPDLTGYVVRKRDGWQMKWRNPSAATSADCWFDNDIFAENAMLKIHGIARSATPFLVKTIRRGQQL